jgi:hypothetical protein
VAFRGVRGREAQRVLGQDDCLGARAPRRRPGGGRHQPGSDPVARLVGGQRQVQRRQILVVGGRRDGGVHRAAPPGAD